MDINSNNQKTKLQNVIDNWCLKKKEKSWNNYMFIVCLFVFIIFNYSNFINGFFMQSGISNLIRNKTILNSVIVGTNKNYLQDYIFSSSISKDTIYIPIALFYFYNH